MDVLATIELARRELQAGHDRRAADLLTDAAYETHDPALEMEIRQVALEGLSHAGRFGKGRWKEVIRIAEVRGAGHG